MAIGRIDKNNSLNSLFVRANLQSRDLFHTCTIVYELGVRICKQYQDNPSYIGMAGHSEMLGNFS